VLRNRPDAHFEAAGDPAAALVSDRSPIDA
jgi:hypothetical protein